MLENKPMHLVAVVVISSLIIVAPFIFEIIHPTLLPAIRDFVTPPIPGLGHEEAADLFSNVSGIFH